MYTKIFIKWQELRPFSPDSLEIRAEKGWHYPLGMSVPTGLLPVTPHIACHRGSLSASQAACPSAFPENLTTLPSPVQFGFHLVCDTSLSTTHKTHTLWEPEAFQKRLCWQVHSLEPSQHLPQTHLAALQVKNTPWGAAGFSVFWLWHHRKYQVGIRYMKVEEKECMSYSICV